MGTNYYARILPKRKQKEALKTLIDNDEFDKIKTQVEKIYGSYQMTSYDGESGGEIHLGKRSAGWKFLWNPNIYIIRNGHIEWIDNGNGHKTGEWIIDPNTYHFVYPLTKEGIKSFIDREDVVIYDEYDEKQDKEEFWKMALEWTTWNNKEAFDSKSYVEWELSQNPNYREYTCNGEYVNALKFLGFKMISSSNSDFYSDGLRFATTTDFS